MEKKLRLLVHAKGAPAWNMAVDEALFASAIEKKSLPCLRVYTWKNPCATYGCFADYEHVRHFLSEALPHRFRFCAVRRPTGGGIVLHGDDLTFSLCGETLPFFGFRDVQETYQKIHRAIVTGFSSVAFFAQELFINKEDGENEKNSGQPGVCFRAPVRHDVMKGEKKFAGGAQRRSGNFFLHQGTIQLEAGMLSFTEALSALCGGFRGEFGAAFQISTLSADEKSKTQRLESMKYRAKSWNKNGKVKAVKECGLLEKIWVK